jgi:3-deoxy-D-manno-octulosonate 8-phosphate phosphatase (KDO 8-P phosphatase)
MISLETLYGEIGGRFISSPSDISERLKNIRAFVFDWDGVFNNGQKMSTGGSAFSEVDSMGTNLLRFSYFLNHQQMPLCALISGEKNETAFYFSEREGFDYSFFKVAHKKEALNFLCEKETIRPEQVAYFFDDVLDLPIAELCGIRILIDQKINPLFRQYCVKHKLVDYATSVAGGSGAVREATELLIGLTDNYDAVISGRVANSEQYQDYISRRRQIKTEFFSLSSKGIEAVNRP